MAKVEIRVTGSYLGRVFRESDFFVKYLHLDASHIDLTNPRVMLDKLVRSYREKGHCKLESVLVSLEWFRIVKIHILENCVYYKLWLVMVIDLK